MNNEHNKHNEEGRAGLLQESQGADTDHTKQPDAAVATVAGSAGAGAATGDDTSGIASAVQPINSFDEMGLSMELLRGIYAYGFEKPSAIQQRAIKP